MTFSKEFLQQEYIQKQKTINEIAEEFSSSWATISKLLNKFNIPQRAKGNHRRKNLSGQKFGKLLVICYEGHDGIRPLWLCKCDCGNTRHVLTSRLTGGFIKSCGCDNFPKREISKCFKGCGEISKCNFNKILEIVKRKKYEFDLTIEFLWELFLKQNRKCALSGIEIKFGSKKELWRLEQTASLDRKDSTKGYVKDNVQWVHKHINKMKQHFSQEDFIKFCTAVSNNQR